MGKLLRKGWRYFVALLTGRFDELADPKIQIDQAIAEAQTKHKRLRANAANVIANQKRTQMQLDKARKELETADASAKQALVMAADAEAAGETERAARFTNAAENFANRAVALEGEVATLETLLLDATRSADQAKAAVAANANELQSKITERRELLNRLGQAEMAEELSASMEDLHTSVGSEVPTLDEVRTKIDDRLARAQGTAELHRDSVEGSMMEVKHAARTADARARLSKMRSELGIATSESAQATNELDAQIEAEIEEAVARDAGKPAASGDAG